MVIFDQILLLNSSLIKSRTPAQAFRPIITIFKGQAELFRSLGKALRDMGATQRHPFKRSGPMVNKFAAYVDDCVNKAFALSGLGTGIGSIYHFYLVLFALFFKNRPIKASRSP